ncbi:MAG: NUDIX domain-containing protein [Rhodobacteraceae bacterium]|nr:NUDIX domain-containing protein [Paracoccaceae bacterium]
MSFPIFLFGTLRHAPLRAAVLGSDCPAHPIQLAGFQVVEHAGYPVLSSQSGAVAEGLVLTPNADQLARLEFYEGLFGYSRHLITDEQEQSVYVYRPDTDPPLLDAAPWVLSDWVAVLGDAATLATADVMALRADYPADHLAIRYPMLLSHASARVRARAEHASTSLRRTAQPDDVVPVSTAHPYAYFFGVQSNDLRFRRFDGSLSPVVRRAAFLMSDAVTLLPYDPVRDCVLLVEQFRYGLYLRDAPNCWSIEAIAGRIDPGETPTEAALREAREEAGLELQSECLELIGQAYPSPGCVTECLFQFVALCDLPENDGAVNGLESEAEDIRRHVISFDRLMQLAQSGEAQNGPLLTSIFWLALHRERLRKP